MTTCHFNQISGKIMKRSCIILALLGLLINTNVLYSQNMSDIRINEILVTNTDDFEDDFGNKNGWIELFNTSYATVDISGCYLTNDPENLTKYLIPRGDILTKIKPRQHTLFWADSEPYRGTFHINFLLKDSKEVILVSSDGRTILDRVVIPHSLLSDNVSYGRFRDGVEVKGEDRSIDLEKTWGLLSKTSPSTNNYGADIEPPGMVLMKIDPFGAIMSFTAMSVVFISLILLYVVFKNTGNYNMSLSRKKAERAAAGSKQKVSEEEISAELFAAISAALHTYFEDDETHDIEHTILTIDKVTRNYSPWSSKIYTLRETPKKS